MVSMIAQVGVEGEVVNMIALVGVWRVRWST